MPDPFQAGFETGLQLLQYKDQQRKAKQQDILFNEQQEAKQEPGRLLARLSAKAGGPVPFTPGMAPGAAESNMQRVSNPLSPEEKLGEMVQSIAKYPASAPAISVLAKMDPQLQEWETEKGLKQKLTEKRSMLETEQPFKNLDILQRFGANLGLIKAKEDFSKGGISGIKGRSGEAISVLGQMGIPVTVENMVSYIGKMYGHENLDQKAYTKAVDAAVKATESTMGDSPNRKDFASEEEYAAARRKFLADKIDEYYELYKFPQGQDGLNGGTGEQKPRGNYVKGFIEQNSGQ